MSISIISHSFEKHLSEDNWPSADEEGQVVGVEGVKLVLLSDGKPEDCPDGTVDCHVGNEAGLRRGRQGGLSIMGGGSFRVHLLLRSAAVG